MPISDRQGISGKGPDGGLATTCYAVARPNVRGRTKHRPVLTAVLLLSLSACQMPETSRPAAPAATLRFPDSDVAQGVAAFRSAVAQRGMVGVARDVQKCQGTLAPGMPADLIRQCFAFETAAFNVSLAHDAATHARPLPGLSAREFTHQLDAYCARLGISAPACPAARQAMFEQVSDKLGPA